MDYDRLRAEIEKELWKCYVPFASCNMEELSYVLIDLIKAEIDRGPLANHP